MTLSGPGSSRSNRNIRLRDTDTGRDANIGRLQASLHARLALQEGWVRQGLLQGHPKSRRGHGGISLLKSIVARRALPPLDSGLACHS